MSAGADFVDQLFLHKWPISLPVVEDSNEIRKHDKREKMKNINKLKNCENINFDECWRLFFDVTPAWKRSKIGKCENIYLDGYSKSFFGKNSVYLRDITFKPKYWDLSWAIKMEYCTIEKVNNSIAKKLCANLLNNRKEINYL